MGQKKLDSEYKSHYKTLPVHRPVTVKAKTSSHPSDNAPEALESSRRAGLLSNQFSQIIEPALQRKKIVPYKHNHNIFQTNTVKELGDGEWLDAVGSDDDTSRSACSHGKNERPNLQTQSKKEQTEYSSHYANKPVEKESPIMLANKVRTVKKSKNYGSQVKNTSAKISEYSPERLPPAGRPTYISDPHDKRLLRPSDGSAYLTFPDEHPADPRKTETEYSERYYNAVPKNKERTANISNEESSNINEATYKKVLLNRSAAYGITPKTLSVKKPSFGSEKGSDVGDRTTTKQQKNAKRDSKRDFNREESLSSFHSTDSYTRGERKRQEAVAKGTRRESERNRRRQSLDSESMSSLRSSSRLDEIKKLGSEQSAHKESSSSVKNVKEMDKRTKRRSRRHAWEEGSTPCENGIARDTRGKKGSLVDVVERGRSPTPEMRNVGQSRRHHLDVTTGSNNPLASIEERSKTRVLEKVPTETRLVRPHVSYDPSRYSDTGDQLSARSTSTLTQRGSIDSRSLVATQRR